MTTITRCTHCGETFGTRAALSIHKPGNCRSEKTMRRAGAWRGYAGIWWTVDLGLDDESLGQQNCGSQVIENTDRKLGQNANQGQGCAPPCLSKFRGALH